MVNFNNSTKMMVHRCIELLNAKIANAQTRHIARRVPFQRVCPRYLDSEAMHKERQKAEKYEESKRLSMWEQEAAQKKDSSQSSRLDHLYYKHCGLNERKYHTTWVNFPEQSTPKIEQQSRFEERMPIYRRKNEHQPDTAKPWDEEATDFLKQWDNNNAMINRNRYEKAQRICESPLHGNQKYSKKKIYRY